MLRNVLATERAWWAHRSPGMLMRYCLLPFRLYPLLLIAVFGFVTLSVPWSLARQEQGQLVLPVMSALAGTLLTCSCAVLLVSFASVSVIHGLVGVRFVTSAQGLARELAAVVLSVAAIAGRTAALVLLTAPVAITLSLSSTPRAVQGSDSQIRILASTQVGLVVLVVSVASIHLAARTLHRLCADMPPATRNVVSVSIPAITLGFVLSRFEAIAETALALSLPAEVGPWAREAFIQEFMTSAPQPHPTTCAVLTIVALGVIAIVRARRDGSAGR